MRYNRRIHRALSKKPLPKYVPPTPEQVAEQNARIDAYIASLPKPVPYLTPEDPDAFLDMAKQPNPSIWSDMQDYVECPKCHGYGGWHLRINAYGEGVHFNCVCSQCNGFGLVKPGRDVDCIHKWVEIGGKESAELGIPHYGMCYHVYKCAKGCGATMAHDSSD
jgi:hypothetical protein